MPGAQPHCRHGNVRRTLCALLICMAGNSVAADDELDWLLQDEQRQHTSGVDIEWQFQQELYNTRNARATLNNQRLLLTPWLAGRRWLASLELPYARLDTEAQGSITIERTLGGRVIQRPLTAAVSNTESGLEDIRASLLLHPAPHRRVAPFLAIDYKFDNGAVAEGLGSGSRDTRLSSGLTVQRQRLYISLEGGYLWSAGGGLRDRAVANARLDLDLSARWRLENSYDYEQAADPRGEDFRQWQTGLRWQPLPRLALRASWQGRPEADALQRQWLVAVQWQLF